MTEVSFTVAHINQTVPIGFSDGWAVIRHEPGQEPQFASSLYVTEAEARTEANRLIAQQKVKQA
jgi:hypothetical protein